MVALIRRGLYMLEEMMVVVSFLPPSQVFAPKILLFLVTDCNPCREILVCILSLSYLCKMLPSCQPVPLFQEVYMA